MKLRKVVIDSAIFGGATAALKLIEASDPTIEWATGTKPADPRFTLRSDEVVLVIDAKGILTWSPTSFSDTLKRYPEYTKVKGVERVVELRPAIPDTVEMHGRTYKLVEE